MEAAINISRQDSQCHRFTVNIAVLFALLIGADWVSGQTVAPKGDDQLIPHSLANVPQQFPPAVWIVENSQFRDGCVVQWSLNSFTHESNRNLQFDSDLAVRLTKSGNSSRWTVARKFDATNLAAGKDSASVIVTSNRRGDAVAELRVRFIQNQLTSLAAGSYHTTLTGTITGQ